MMQYLKQCRTWTGDNMDIEEIPSLGSDEVEIVRYYHDESIFHANDIAKTYWGSVDDEELPRKGNGRCVMVSEFLSEEHGYLNLEKILPKDQLDAAKQFESTPKILSSRAIIYPGKQGDSWWDCEQLIQQTERHLKLHAIVYPGKTALNIFDCSANHQAMAPNALVVNKMNVNPGGKQPKMRTTQFVHSSQRHLPKDQQTLTEQQMKFAPDSDVFPGEPKGMAHIVKERGLWKDGLTKICSKCKDTSSPIDVQRKVM
jgi:hypothetical protein